MLPDDLRSMPVGSFFRITYSLVVLIKAYISSKSPQSKIGAFLDSQSLKLGHYLDALISKLQETAGVVECRAPLTFLHMMCWCREWYQGQIHDAEFSNASVPVLPEACTIPALSQQARDADIFEIAARPQTNERGLVDFLGEPHGDDAFTLPEKGHWLNSYHDIGAAAAANNVLLDFPCSYDSLEYGLDIVPPFNFDMSVPHEVTYPGGSVEWQA